MSLEAFGVKNLRCLTDTGLVPIRPITVLVGRNSSGKSTFLRAFPLLRQSVENARRSPVLWHHKDYVDFGSIDTAINDRAAERSVTFVFVVDVLSDEQPCKLGMTLAEGPDGAHVRSYDLQVEHTVVRLEFDADHRVTRFLFDGEDVLPASKLWLGEVGILVAPIDARSEGRLIYQSHVKERADARAALARQLNLLRAKLLRLEVQTERSSSKTGRKVEPEPSRADWATESLRALDDEITSFMYRVAYLGPHRASAYRFYRRTDAAVEEVDAQGENLADFLMSLSPSEWTSLADFTHKHLGVEPSVRIEGLNVEILIKEANADRPRNIVDVGFGYAEVLPLCAVLWSSCIREPSPRRRRTSLLAMEQPELHLHPAHQASLARMIVGALQESRTAGHEVRLMIETHSESLINGLGKLVYDGSLKAEDVQIVLFDQDEDTGETTVDLTGYDGDGALQDNWPYGFLSPIAERRVRPAAE